MLTVGKLKDLLDNVEDNVEIRVSISNGMLDIKSLEYTLDKNEIVKLKVDLDEYLELAKLLESGKGEL